MASEKVGGTMWLNAFDVCTPVIFHKPLSSYENISLNFWCVKIQLQLHMDFDNIVGGRHNEP